MSNNPKDIDNSGNVSALLKFRLLSASPYILLGTLLTGLGYVHEKGMERQDANLEEKLTKTQQSLIHSAASAGECSVLRHNFARLCHRETPDHDNNAIRIISPDDLKHDVDHEFNM